MQLFRRSISARSLTAFGFEMLLVSGSLVVATRLYGPPNDPTLLWRIAFSTALFLACLYYNDFYDFTMVLGAGGLRFARCRPRGSPILAALVYIVLPAITLEHSAFFPSLFLCLATLLLWRFAFNLVIQTPQLDRERAHCRHRTSSAGSSLARSPPSTTSRIEWWVLPGRMIGSATCAGPATVLGEAV